ncbi:MAG: hypothetical protein AAFZ38_04095 [Myxococcota bacterium]
MSIPIQLALGAWVVSTTASPSYVLVFDPCIEQTETIRTTVRATLDGWREGLSRDGATEVDLRCRDDAVIISVDEVGARTIALTDIQLPGGPRAVALNIIELLRASQDKGSRDAIPSDPPPVETFSQEFNPNQSTGPRDGIRLAAGASVSRFTEPGRLDYGVRLSAAVPLFRVPRLSGEAVFEVSGLRGSSETELGSVDSAALGALIGVGVSTFAWDRLRIAAVAGLGVGRLELSPESDSAEVEARSASTWWLGPSGLVRIGLGLFGPLALSTGPRLDYITRGVRDTSNVGFRVDGWSFGWDTLLVWTF